MWRRGASSQPALGARERSRSARAALQRQLTVRTAGTDPSRSGLAPKFFVLLEKRGRRLALSCLSSGPRGTFHAHARHHTRTRAGLVCGNGTHAFSGTPVPERRYRYSIGRRYRLTLSATALAWVCVSFVSADTLSAEASQLSADADGLSMGADEDGVSTWCPRRRAPLRRRWASCRRRLVRCGG